MIQQSLTESGGSCKLTAIRQVSRRIHRRFFIFGSPLSDSIEVFQREADRIHQFVAAGAGLIGTVLRHTLPHRQNLTCGTIILQRWHIWWWWRRWQADEIGQNP